MWSSRCVSDNIDMQDCRQNKAAHGRPGLTRPLRLHPPPRAAWPALFGVIQMSASAPADRTSVDAPCTCGVTPHGLRGVLDRNNGWGVLLSRPVLLHVRRFRLGVHPSSRDTGGLFIPSSSPPFLVTDSCSNTGGGACRARPLSRAHRVLLTHADGERLPSTCPGRSRFGPWRPGERACVSVTHPRSGSPDLCRPAAR